MSSTPKPTERVWMLSGRLHESEPLRDTPITVSPFRVGRQPNLHLSLESPSVSNLHADIYETDGALRITDLGSTNGTFVNGERIERGRDLHEGDIIQIADVVFRLTRQVTTRAGTATSANAVQAVTLTRFDQMIADGEVIPFFQPIVARDGHTFGFEVMARSHLTGLDRPSAIFQAAAKLNLEAECSRVCRSVGIEGAQALAGRPRIFVNTHPRELADPDAMVQSLRDVRAQYRETPIVLEIHESALTDNTQMRQLKQTLDELRIELAYDDFGAGRDRLVEIVEVTPDYVKFDITLVKDIHKASPQRRQMLANLVRMVQDLGIRPIAEGVESAEDADTCTTVGFDLSQGFFHGSPAPAETFAG